MPVTTSDSASNNIEIETAKSADWVGFYFASDNGLISVGRMCYLLLCVQVVLKVP